MTNSNNVILYLFISIIFIYILYRIIHQRYLIPIIDVVEPISIMKNKESELANIIDKSSDSYINNIQSISKSSASMALREYCVKSSFNSASTGNFVSIAMVLHVLSRGCRFLDFEIFYISKGDAYEAVVGFTTDPKYNIAESKNTIPLNDVLAAIAINAFTDTVPNGKDPLFINFRIKSNEVGAYNAVAKSIHSNIKSTIYKGKVTRDTTLDSLLKKTIIMVDKTINRKYAKIAECDDSNVSCFDLNNYINCESGGEDFNLFHYSNLIGQAYVPILIKDDNIRTTASNIRIAIPDKVALSTNPNINDYIVKYGCQYIACMFQNVDDNLNNYEEFFNNSRSSIVPLSYAITFFTNYDSLM